jgi:cobalt-zinc-cadmium efflux system outer membrane protein
MRSRRGVGAAILAVALLSLPTAACGQSPATELTVDELVARALTENPELKAARLEVDAAVGRLRQAGLRPNPMLELAGQKAISPDNNVSIGVQLPLDLNGRKEGRVGVAERDIEVRRGLVAERERRLRADVRMKAAEVLASRRNLDVLDELLQVNRSALELVGARVREGAAPAIDGNLQVVEVNRLDAARQLMASRVEVATLRLKVLTAMAADAPLSLRGDLSALSPPTDRAEAVRRALAQRQDVVLARAERDMATARIRKEEAEGRWDATVSVGYQRQDMGFGLNGLTASGALRPIQDVFHFFGGGVSIVLPVRNRNQGNIAAAEAEARAAERRIELTTLVVQQEVAAAFAQHEAARRSRQIYEAGVRDVARRNLDVVRQAYDLGRGSLLDVVAEQRRYIEIENGYTDVLKQVYDAWVDIERAVGAATP